MTQPIIIRADTPREADACPVCGGSGFHAPVVAWPALPEYEERRLRAGLPDQVACGFCATTEPKEQADG